MTHAVSTAAPPGALIPLDAVERMAMAMAKSGLFGIKTPDQALALMLVAQAEGMHPATAARDFHIIGNRPALKADAMLARFLAAGGRVKWLEMTDERVAAEFSHPAGGTVEVDWTPSRAKQAGISNDMHRKYPRQMLRARVISEGIRTVFPGVAVGVYTPEEVVDMDRPPTPGRVDDTLSRVTNEPDDALLQRARNAASRGTAEYRTFWVNISEADRTALENYHLDLKHTAKNVDAKATATDVEEVTQ